jgi:hypothetical protein
MIRASAGGNHAATCATVGQPRPRWPVTREDIGEISAKRASTAFANVSSMTLSRATFVLSAAALFVTLAGAFTEADACSKAPDPLPPGTFIVSLYGSSAESAPKNAGLVFQTFRTPDVSEAARIAETKITVRSGEREIVGALRRVGQPSDLTSLWVWMPSQDSGVLPPGIVHITATSTTQPEPLVEADVTIDDRLLTPSQPAPRIELRRGLIADDGAPTILCKWQGDSAACESGPQEKLVASRVKGLPVLGFFMPELADARFLEQQVELFGRSGGVKSESQVVARPGGGGAVRFTRPYDEYCAKVTTRLLADGTASEQEICTPHGELDLAVSEEEERNAVNSQLSGCETTVFPPGTSAEDPTGTASSVGCSAHGRQRGLDFAGGGGAVLVGGIVALLRRRRKNGAAHSAG